MKNKKMSSIEKARKLMKDLEEGIYLSNEDLLYLFCIHTLYLGIGYRLPHTFISSFYHENSLMEIKSQIDNQSSVKELYNQFNTEAAVLQFILTYEMGDATYLIN
jgi:hypothetical protein